MAITKVSPNLLDLDAGITISVADNSDNLTLTSTDADASSGPNLNLYRNSGSPADNDEVANIAFNGRNDNSQDVKYAEIEAYIRDASDGTEDGMVNFNTMVSGSGTSRMKLDTSETVFNDDSKDLDFRVESDGNANMLFVNGGGDAVGIGTGSPGAPLHVQMTHTSTDVTQANANETLVLGNSGSGDGVYNAIKFGGNQQDMYIMSFNDNTLADRRMGFFLGSVAGDAVADERLSIRGDGKVGIGTTSPNALLTVGSTGTSGPELQIMSSTSGSGYLYFGDGTSGTARYDGFIGYNQHTSYMVFATGGGNERMRIDSSGRLLIGATSNLRTNEKLQVDGAEGVVARATANGGGCFVGLESSGNSAGGAFYGMTSGGTINFKVAVGGNVTNTNNSYGQISDIKLKENIVDATNKLDELKQIKIRNFNFIGDDTKQIGVVAQELETIFPALITDTEDVDADGNNAGTTTKEVKYSVLLPIAIKAIQELTTKLEAAEARITTLEG